MPTPAELFSSDPFVAELRTIANIANDLGRTYINKDVAVLLPFTNAPVSAALSSTQGGIDAINTSLAQGLADLQQRVAALVVPSINLKPVVAEADPIV